MLEALLIRLESEDVPHQEERLAAIRKAKGEL
jgi:hypothetical protein